VIVSLGLFYWSPEKQAVRKICKMGHHQAEREERWRGEEKKLLIT